MNLLGTILIGAGLGSGYNFDTWHDGNKCPFTVSAQLIVPVEDESEVYVVREVQVPYFAEAYPIICFEIHGRRAIQCLYKKPTGITTIETVLPKGEEKL